MRIADESGTVVLARAREFIGSVETQVASRAADRDNSIPTELLEHAVELGLATLRLPAYLGGAEMSMADYVRVIEEIGHGPGVLRVFLHGQNVKWELLERFGTKPQRERYLPTFTRGEWALSFAITEPDRGTGLDVGTTAQRVADGWEITGRKHLISNGVSAAAWVVLARTDDREVTCFLVPAETAGASAEPMAAPMGTRGLGLARLEFKRCVVPMDAVLGGVGEGMKVASAFLDISRTSLAASAVGCAQRALDLSLDHVGNRRTFGRPLADRQMVQAMLADMEERVRASRALVREAAIMIDAGQEVTIAAAVAKRFAARAVGEVTDIALRLAGGIGYTAERDVEQLYRDARAYWFEEGTHEVQALLIARGLLGEAATRPAVAHVGIS